MCWLQMEKPALGRLLAALEQGKPARSVPLTDTERAAVRGLQLLTLKPLIYAINVAEQDLADKGASNHHVDAICKRAREEDCSTVIVSAQVSLIGGSQFHAIPYQSHLQAALKYKIWMAATIGM